MYTFKNKKYTHNELIKELWRQCFDSRRNGCRFLSRKFDVENDNREIWRFSFIFDSMDFCTKFMAVKILDAPTEAAFPVFEYDINRPVMKSFTTKQDLLDFVKEHPDTWFECENLKRSLKFGCKYHSGTNELEVGISGVGKKRYAL